MAVNTNSIFLLKKREEKLELKKAEQCKMKKDITRSELKRRKTQKVIYAKNKTVFMRFINCNILLDIPAYTYANVHFIFLSLSLFKLFKRQESLCKQRDFIGFGIKFYGLEQCFSTFLKSRNLSKMYFYFAEPKRSKYYYL